MHTGETNARVLQTPRASKTRSTWELARLAECLAPDSRDGIGIEGGELTAASPSPGAVFLREVEEEVFERLQGDTCGEDAIYEIADAAVPIHTHLIWQTFVDLGGYEEDQRDLCASEAVDLTELARRCLALIAERLARAITAELEDVE